MRDDFGPTDGLPNTGKGEGENGMIRNHPDG